MVMKTFNSLLSLFHIVKTVPMQTILKFILLLLQLGQNQNEFFLRTTV